MPYGRIHRERRETFYRRQRGSQRLGIFFRVVLVCHRESLRTNQRPRRRRRRNTRYHMVWTGARSRRGMGGVLSSRDREPQTKDVGDSREELVVQRQEIEMKQWTANDTVMVVAVGLLTLLHFFNSNLAFAILTGLVLSRW